MMQVFDNQGNLKQKSLVTSGVNSVTATPPLFSTGGSAPDISIALATALSDGYLSSVDWSTFNNKQNALTLTTIGSSGAATLIGATLNIPQYTDQYLGTVTSVGLSAGTGISIGGTNPVTSSGTISVTNTAPDQIVALTAGTGIGVSGTYPNFTITNSAPSPAGAITGTGTTNYIPKFTSSSAIGNSLLYDNGTYIGLGTTNPQYLFHTVTSAASIAAFRNSGAANGQVLIGNTVGDLILRILSSGDALIFSDVSKYLAFGTNGATERMRITSGGELLINTTTDAGDFKLQVSGNAYVSGSVGIGSTSTSNGLLTIAGTAPRAINMAATFTGGTSRFGILQNNTVNSDVTSSAVNNYSQFATQAAAFTLTTASHYTIAGITIGAGSSVTNQIGYRATNITEATNNYGFYGEIASGTGRWNLYMVGTADNYLAGNLGIGATSPVPYSGGARTLNLYSSTTIGEIKITNSTTGNAAAAGLVLTQTGLNSAIANINNGYLSFATNETERMRITSGGEVLINTTSDAGDYKLQVNGNAYLTGTTTVLLNMNNTTASTGKNWRFSSASNGNFYITHDGVVDAIQLTPTTGNATFAGSIKTAAPSGGTAAAWKLGSKVAATVSLVTTDYIEVEIGGVAYKLALVN